MLLTKLSPVLLARFCRWQFLHDSFLLIESVAFGGNLLHTALGKCVDYHNFNGTSPVSDKRLGGGDVQPSSCKTVWQEKIFVGVQPTGKLKHRVPSQRHTSLTVLK